MAACACLASSTGSPESAVSLNSIPIGARADRIGVQATQPRPTTFVSPVWCSTIGQSSNTVKCSPSSSARRNASRSVSLTSYMMWCSSTTPPDRSVPQVPSIRLRGLSSRKTPALRRPMRVSASSTARRRMASGSSSARISSNAASSAASLPCAVRFTTFGTGSVGPRMIGQSTRRRRVTAAYERLFTALSTRADSARAPTTRARPNPGAGRSACRTPTPRRRARRPGAATTGPGRAPGGRAARSCLRRPAGG